ncbi:MAG: SLBB domain-containing protein [Verrucomicrobiae bacterium]|nr:SLBB domain-containing protein [Verrucomicrobiae bacterium]MDW8308675.1 SLBB domain-containing protein [Verrucomicrobiales bacterium]
MKSRNLKLLGLAGFLAIWGAPSFGQTSTPAADYKQAREEFALAEQAAQKRQVSAESFQRELDRLLEQKQRWNSELTYARGKLAYAEEKLKHFTALNLADEIHKWQGQVENWSTRVKAASSELEKVESEIQSTVQALQTSLQQADENALLLPGESIEVFVAEDETLNGVYQVRRGGYVILPRVGRVMVAGKTLAAAEKAIKDALAQGQIKDATVMVERPQGGVGGEGPVVYLSGEFLKPGAWRIPAGVAPTVVTTILRSGGLTDEADLTRVRLLRLVSGQALVEEVNVRAILDGDGLQTDLTVQPGDIIVVPAYANLVYVTGNVLKPGALQLKPGEQLTAYSAILRAGGFARFANRKKVYVLRDKGDGVKEKIPVSIKDIQNRGGADVILQSRDIVVVPEKFFSF